MKWLDGHPLSMRLILPSLETTEPDVLLDRLRGIAPWPPGTSTEGERATSLAASIAYSYDYLPADARRLLVAVSLFQGVADVGALTAFSRAPGVPERFHGAPREEWENTLDGAAEVGLLTRLGAGLYQIHPALPAYLAGQWRSDDPEGHETVREAATQALLVAYSSLGAWLYGQIESGSAQWAFTMIDFQRRTMGSLLGYAIDQGRWENAQSISQPLNEYWNACGLQEEAGAWTDRVRLATEGPDGTAPPLDTQAGGLWLFFIGQQANRQVISRHLDEAEHTYEQILTAQQQQLDSQQQQLAATYHQLGRVAQERTRLDDAEGWYTKALAINEELRNRPGMAINYNQLGIVAQARERLNDAEDWYTKSLTIKIELGDWPGIAYSYGQLGNLAEARGRLDDAEGRYLQSLAIMKELPDRPGMAIAYHQLGIVAEARGRLDEAEGWYTKSLAINEELRNLPGMATTYHQLGRVAQDRGRLDDAENWYTKSVAIQEALRDRPGMGASYNRLGIVAEALGRLDQAEGWYTKSLAIEEGLNDRSGMRTSYYRLGNVAYLLGRLDDAEGWYTKSLAIYAEIQDRPSMASCYGQLGLVAEEQGKLRQALELIIKCVALFDEFPHPATGPGPHYLAQLTNQLGIGTLETSWQTITDSPLPEAVRDYIGSSQIP